MKRFIVSVLCVTVFCIGLGALVEKVGASFKSDERALALIRQARLAIGGEQSIADVRSMIIKGNTTLTFKVDGNGGTRSDQGETEIAMQLPDKLSKTVKIGRHEGPGGESLSSEKHDVMIMRRGEGTGEGIASGQGGKKVIVTKVDDGNGEVEKVVTEGKDGEFTTADGKTIFVRRTGGPEIEKVIVGGAEKGKRIMLNEEIAGGHEAHRQNELLRTTLSLLLTAPEGMDVSYTYVGESDVDGTTCNVVNAEFAGSNVKLFLSKTSSLPMMVSYQGHAMPNVMFFRTKEPAAGVAAPGEGSKERVMTFNHKIEAPELAEVQVRFADYRSVNGVQLPYKWTTSLAGQTSEVFDVTSYDLNPTNIAETFQKEKVFLRTKKEAN